MIETWRDFFVVISLVAVLFTVTRLMYVFIHLRVDRVDTFDWVERLQRGEELHSDNLFEQGEE